MTPDPACRSQAAGGGSAAVPGAAAAEDQAEKARNQIIEQARAGGSSNEAIVQADPLDCPNDPNALFKVDPDAIPKGNGGGCGGADQVNFMPDASEGSAPGGSASGQGPQEISLLP